MYKSNLKQNLINEWHLRVESALAVNRISTVEELLLASVANFLRYFAHCGKSQNLDSLCEKRKKIVFKRSRF